MRTRLESSGILLVHSILYASSTLPSRWIYATRESTPPFESRRTAVGCTFANGSQLRQGAA